VGFTFCRFTADCLRYPAIKSKPHHYLCTWRFALTAVFGLYFPHSAVSASLDRHCGSTEPALGSPIPYVSEVSMVAQCANPACNRLFRELSKGRLFLLPPITGDSSYWTWSAGKLADHCYWLCPECDPTHTITRIESGVVVSVRDPGTPYPAPAAAPGRRKRPGQISLRSHTETA